LKTKHSRPVGQPTRGKTALNRLRQVDVYMGLAWATHLHGAAPLIVDVGYGAYPWTALEMLQRWQRINPRLRLLGLEIDPERVANALPFCQPPHIDFRIGGFNVADITGTAQVRLIRAYNVLRQYDEAAVPDALLTMAQALEIGGLLIEGTSNPSGRIVVFDVYRKEPDASLRHLELVFGTNFKERIDPVDFQAILPKRLIHHAQDARPSAFFDAWRQALLLARGMGHIGIRRSWQTAMLLLRERFGYAIPPSVRLIRRGYLVLRDTL
jgi:hypothetical protein